MMEAEIKIKFQGKCLSVQFAIRSETNQGVQLDEKLLCSESFLLNFSPAFIGLDLLPGQWREKFCDTKKLFRSF
jgi:hypothetical protein